MDFALSATDHMILENVRRLEEQFDRKEWLRCAREDAFPQKIWKEMGELGLLGLHLPERYGGAGLGVLQAEWLQETMGETGTALLYFVVGPVMAGIPIARHGSEALKARYLPPLLAGEERFCFAITEPNAGSNSFRIETIAERHGDRYVVNGQKTFITGVNHAEHILLICRTTPAAQVARKTDGMAVLVVDTQAPGVHFTQLDTQVPVPERQFQITFDQVEVPLDQIVGAPDHGFEVLFDSLDAERITIGAMCVGFGRYALQKAVAYARQRNVFGAPIGSYQGLAHPMAEAKARLEQASLMLQKAAWRFDQGEDAGAEANIGKYAAAEAGIAACDIAIQVHGGNGFTASTDLLSLWAFNRLMRTAPVSREMILNYIDQHLLGLPRSY